MQPSPEPTIAGAAVCARAGTCPNFVVVEAASLTPHQRVVRHAIVGFEHFLKLLSLMGFTAATAAFLTLYLVQPGHAQPVSQRHINEQSADQQVAQAATNAGTEIKIIDMDRRIDKIEIHQSEQDRRASDVDSKVAGIYAFGGGVSCILVVLQVFSLLSPLKKSPTI